MPVYNGQLYISKSIESVLAQTYENWELIIVNDGSTDLTEEIVIKFQNLTNKVKYFYKVNGGQVKATNFGILKSNGVYVAFLDSDDLWERDKLNKQVNFISKNKNIDFLYAKYNSIDENGNLLSTNNSHDSLNHHEDLLKRCFIGRLTVMVKKSILVELDLFDEFLHSTDDWDMWIRISKKFQLSFLDEVVASYRIHPQSMSKNSYNQLLNVSKVYAKHVFSNSELNKQFKNDVKWIELKIYLSSFLNEKKFQKVFLIFYEMLKINRVDTIYLFFKLSLISLKSKLLNLRPIKC
jgi:glycosyltransferase involved in cell wall biosynthesis